MNLIRLVFNTIWLMVNQKIQQKELKVLRDKAFKIASEPKYDGYQRGLVSMVYKFFDKKSGESGVDTEPNYDPVNELHRQIIRKFKRRKFIHPLETIFGMLIQVHITEQKQQRNQVFVCN